MLDSSTSPGRPLTDGQFWIRASISFAPALILAVSSGLADPMTEVGLILLLITTNYLILQLLVYQTRLLRPVSNGMLPAVSSFRALEKLPTMDTYGVAYELDRLSKNTLNANRTILLALDGRGGMSVLGGNKQDTDRITEYRSHIAWFENSPATVSRATLNDIGPCAEREAILSLLDSVGVNLILPLRTDTELFGLALIDAPGFEHTDNETLLSVLQSIITIALLRSVSQSDELTLESSFKLAGVLQEALMPSETTFLCQGFSIHGAFRPCEHCGGDVWAWHDLGEGCVLIFVGDATGHGPPAAMVSAAVKGVVEAYAAIKGSALDPGDLLGVVDKWVRKVGSTEYVMTAFAMVVDRVAGEVRFANAGHNFPYVLSPHAEQKVRILPGTGDLLGSAVTAQVARGVVEIEPDARFVLYTDGIPEAGLPTRAAYSDRRFRRRLGELMHRSAGDIVSTIMSELRYFLGDSPPDDDITMVVVEVPASIDETLVSNATGAEDLI